MKKCIKCGVVKDLSKYYAHPEMKDGHLNKCKDCQKASSKKTYYKKIKDPDWIESERARGRLKQRKRTSLGKNNYSINRSMKYIERYPEKRLAINASQHIKVDKGFNRHHWSYNDEHFKDIIPLSFNHHMKAHRFIVYDQERKMYRRFDTNELLDTRSKHESFITKCIIDYED